MKLMTKKQEEQLVKNYKLQNANPDKDMKNKAVIKLFNPYGLGTWYVSEYDPEEKIGFGVADLGFPEMGSFPLWELEEIKNSITGLGIERDLSFPENKYTLTECLEMCRNG
mgnify:FL=1|tara:strand:+ start:72 stop:404 length:333 start_codon:yes stop_codon:yes gene_type:complete